MNKHDVLKLVIKKFGDRKVGEIPVKDLPFLKDIVYFVIRKTRTQLFKLCESCNGSGVEHNPDYPPCSICNGDGVVKK